MMTTNLYVIANVKQLRTGGSFNSFHSRVEFGMILDGLRNFGEGGVNPPQTSSPSRHATEISSNIGRS